MSVKQEATAFPGTRVALIKIGLYMGMFCFVFEPKRSEGDREKSRAVDYLPNGKKDQLIYNERGKKRERDALQIYKVFIIYGLWI